MTFNSRRLPHYHVLGEPHFITFRLQGSLPPGRFFGSEAMTSGEAFVHMDRLLDRASYGPLHLKLPSVAQIVKEAIVTEPGWTLHEWVLMANHAHLPVTPTANLSKTMQRVKGVSARLANAELSLSGRSFWQHESYDRLVRGREEFRNIRNYIRANPVKAGIVKSAETFRWSSAFAEPGQRD